MLQPAWLGTPRCWQRWASGGRGACEFTQFPHKITHVVPATQTRYPTTPTTPPIPVRYLQSHRLQAQSLSANQSGCFRKRCFSTSKTTQEPKRCVSFSHFSLTASLPRYPHAPQGSAPGKYRLLPNPYRKLEGGSQEVSRANQSPLLPS